MDDQELGRTLGRMESKLDGLHERLNGQDERMNAHSTRLGKIEQAVARHGVIGGLATVVFGAIAAKLGNLW